MDDTACFLRSKRHKVTNHIEMSPKGTRKLRAKSLGLLTRDEVIEMLEAGRNTKRPPILSGRRMIGIDLSGMDFTSEFLDESGFNAQVLAADFRNTKLRNCYFSGADLACANLRGADLSNSTMVRTNLYSALLEGATASQTDLRGANLVSAELHQTKLNGANLAGARFGWTSISGVDLSQTEGLDEVVHIRPSAIGSDTLRMTANGLANEPQTRRTEVFRFLSSSGLDDELLSVFRTWIEKPIEFYSVFISHSSLDKEFARKLYDDLRAIGVKCWFDEHQILPGDRILDVVDQGIRLWDKLLLVCSENSLSARTGWWVEQELERALLKERELRRTRNKAMSVLIPITIDNFVFDGWKSGFKPTIIERHVGDFRNWKDRQSYASALERLRAAINAARGQ